MRFLTPGFLKIHAINLRFDGITEGILDFPKFYYFYQIYKKYLQ